ncbi:MAG: hypothetical protein ABW048_11175, partial [Sphingobium sp.]
ALVACGSELKECNVGGANQWGDAQTRRSHRKYYSAASRRNLWWRRPGDPESPMRLRVNQSEG